MRPLLRSYNDPSCPVHDPETCEFRCAAPDCPEGSHDPLPKCSACHATFCPDHMLKINDELVCDGCYKCEVCRKDACGVCESCGSFACATHLKERCMYDRDTGYSEQSEVCQRCAA